MCVQSESKYMPTSRYNKNDNDNDNNNNNNNNNTNNNNSNNNKNNSKNNIAPVASKYRVDIRAGGIAMSYAQMKRSLALVGNHLKMVSR